MKGFIFAADAVRFSALNNTQNECMSVCSVSISRNGMHTFVYYQSVCINSVLPSLLLLQAVARHGPTGPTNQELRAFWVTDHQGKKEGEDEGLGGMERGLTNWLTDRRGTGVTVPTVSDDNIQSPRCQRRLQCLYSPPIQKFELSRLMMTVRVDTILGAF